MYRFGRLLIAGGVVAALVVTPAAAQSTAASQVAHYDHIFVIVEENHGFTDVIGNPAAPNLNALAKQFGLATNYFGVTHPSEPNYVALLGGNTFGVADDNPFWMNTIDKPNLVSQLDQAGISWKAYLQALPYPGYQGICYPARCNGSPDVDPLYVSKHDAIQNFTTSRTSLDWSRQVPIEQLNADLSSGNLPAFGYIIPDECHDEHGDPPYCLDSGNPFDPQDQHLVAFGDAYLGKLMASITGASFWPTGKNAVVILYDEGDDNAGCCDAANGGGRVASIVVTNHGPRKLKDPTAYNHYSLLQTIQQSFGLGCLEFTCDTANVKPLAPLFAMTNSKAIQTQALAVPNFATPSPTPDEPVTFTTNTQSSDGWSVVPAPVRGTNDNSLGGVAGSAANDVWAVGNFVPDTPNSNQDATLSLAMHFDGTQWAVTPTPNAGPNFNTLFAAAAAGGHAWGVGVDLDSDFQTRGLIESWDPVAKRWSIDSVPQPGSERDLFFAASAFSPTDVWAVGEQQNAQGTFSTLVERWDGSAWHVVTSPNPGSVGNHLSAVAALAPDNVWAVGQRNDGTSPEHELILHWNGAAWSVVPAPSHGTATAGLYSLTADHEGGLWAAGETVDVVGGGNPLIERIREGDSAVTIVGTPSTGSRWSTLWGVAALDGMASAVGTVVNMTTGNNANLILSGQEGGFRIVNAPNPSADTSLLGAATTVGDTIWAVGHFRPNGPRAPLIMRHPAQ